MRANVVNVLPVAVSSHAEVDDHGRRISVATLAHALVLVDRARALIRVMVRAKH